MTAKWHTTTHYAVVDTLASISNRAGYPCKKEQGLPDNRRPGDLFVSRLDSDGPGAIDVTIRDPLALSHPCTPSNILTWHEAQEMDKHQKYEVACRRLGWSFKAFVVDVFGGLGQEARDFLTILLKGLLGQREGWQRRGLEATIWQEVSFTIMIEIGRQLS